MTNYINTDIKRVNYDYLTNLTAANKTISTLYDAFVQADEYVSKKITEKCFHNTISNIQSMTHIPRPKMGSSHFFPKHIEQYIDDRATYNVQYTCKIKNRDINIYFIITTELTHDEIFLLHEYVHMMYMWLYILDEYSSKHCSKTITIFIYFTPFKKQLPNNQLIVLDTEHINTGYTTGCRINTEIVLYRTEEWFKVFIHETFHNFGLDFSDMNQHTVNKALQNIFNVNIEFNLYESYCEFWARTINTMMYTYQSLKLKHNMSISIFKKTFKINMEKECLHSLFQALKILHFMDLKYKLIMEKTHDNIGICNYLYKEKTSVFSYYIITSLLMNNYTGFMGWCSKNNHSFLQFKKTPGNVESYIEFIYKCSTNSYIKKNINAIEKSFTNSEYKMTPELKMTSLDLWHQNISN
jgi:hypothetical protein